MGIAHRTIDAQRTPDSGPKQQRKAFPKEVKTIGDLLRKCRSERGLNQRELALILQISRDQIQAWERDEAVPEIQEWGKLAEVLSLPAMPQKDKPNSGL